MNELPIYTQIHSRYQVFDVSGQLPFSIVFGLIRRSSADTDPRPLLLETGGSVLDVPYALTHGLLTLQQKDPAGPAQNIAVDLSRLKKVDARRADCLSLPSPVDRKDHWGDTISVYQCYLNVNDEWTSVLEPGKRYVINLASKDLGVKRWAYSDREQLNDDQPSHEFEAVNLVNSRFTGGSASFKVVQSLSWPPNIETRMRLCAPDNALEISVMNTSNDPVTVQTAGHQRILIPWGPFQPESEADDDRMRIINVTSHKSPTSCLQVVDSTTGEVVRDNKQGKIRPLTDSNADKRPRMKDVVTLKPGVPVVRNIDIGALVRGLADGLYKIRMKPRGCRWWYGEVGMVQGEDDRVPAHLGDRITPPLMLESQNEVEFCVRDGKLEAKFDAMPQVEPMGALDP